MNEEQVRQIVKDEMSKNYMSGSPDIPPHSHNGTDNLSLFMRDILGVNLITPMEFYSNINSNPRQGLSNTEYNYNLPVPVIKAGGVGPTGQFLGGNAAEGTIVGFYNPVGTYQIWIFMNGDWHGTDLTLVP